MSYRLPTFNLLAAAWECGGTPSGGSASYRDLQCQKYISSRPQIDVTADYDADQWTQWMPAIVLRFKWGDPPFDVMWRDLNLGIFEVPQDSGRWYRVHWQDMCHEGFPNQYWMAVCTQCDAAGLAWPPPGHDIATGISEDGPCG